MQNITSLFTFYYRAITSSFFVIFFLIFYIKMRIITQQTTSSPNQLIYNQNKYQILSVLLK
ncbi:hypothetical protein FO403_03360 [Salmonella enterica subsp. enterica serovar Give]|nr:hypothetical protein [Salmonella enterica subsp. enterica]EBI3686678.1 hypothetical protein [Salmonella enterica subsp. enterica]ECG9870945.1 hypothetical protein [Salmonella enterica subsp. enterica serovar Give]